MLSASPRVVIVAPPARIQTYTTNRVAELIGGAIVVSETGRRFFARQRRRTRFLVRKRGLGGTVDRYLDLAYFKLRAVLDRHEAIIDRMLEPHGNPNGWNPGLEVHEVTSVNSKASVDLLRRLAPDLIFCNGASILRKPVIEIPRLGVINIHTGILPEYRGSTPEFWALYNADFDKIGVAVHWLTEEIDAGDVILQRNVAYEPGDNEITLRCKNVRVGAELVAEAIQRIAEGRVEAVPQDPTRARTFSRRTRAVDRELRRRLRRWRRSQGR